MAKQKMKSHRGACKRFKITGSGKVKRNKAYKSHILTKKSQKEKERPEKGNYFNKCRSEENQSSIKQVRRNENGKSKKRCKRTQET